MVGDALQEFYWESQKSGGSLFSGNLLVVVVYSVYSAVVLFSVPTHLATHKLVYFAVNKLQYFALNKLQSQRVTFKVSGQYIYLLLRS